MIVIRVLSGKVGPSGRLSFGTVARLQVARLLARRLRAKQVPYKYIFPQGRREGQGGQRPCDVMSLWMYERDAYCESVVTPGGNCDLFRKIDRKLFAIQVAHTNRAKRTLSV